MAAARHYLSFFQGRMPGWSAPEQFDATSEVKPPADIFALGVLFYQLLTGKKPFEGANQWLTDLTQACLLGFGSQDHQP